MIGTSCAVSSNAARARSAALALMLLFALTRAHAEESASPMRYAAAVERELVQMGVHPSCSARPKARFECSYEAAALPSGTRPRIHALYDGTTETVYFYLERYLMLPAASSQVSSVLSRLMELNWELLVGKFEWNARDGEVRLSAVLNTDSNFDRRAFRSIAHSLEIVAARYERELRTLARE